MASASLKPGLWVVRAAPRVLGSESFRRPLLWFDLLFRRSPYDFFIRLFCFGLASKNSQIERPASSEPSAAKQTAETEFISDKFRTTNEKDLAEVEENLTKLGLTGAKAEVVPVAENKTSTAGKEQLATRSRAWRWE